MSAFCQSNTLTCTAIHNLHMCTHFLSASLLLVQQPVWLLQKPFVFGTLLYSSPPPLESRQVLLLPGPRRTPTTHTHTHTHSPSFLHLYIYTHTLAEMWIIAHLNRSIRDGRNMNGQSVDVCVTVIYDSGVCAHDIIRFRAGFTLNCSVAVILEEETPVL